MPDGRKSRCCASVRSGRTLRTDRPHLPPDAGTAMIGFMIHANSLAVATLEARHGRP